MLYCLFEDKVEEFLPLVHFRAVFDLTCGALTLRQKWERALGTRALRIAVRDDLHLYDARTDLLGEGDLDAPGGVWFINGSVIPEGTITSVLRRRLKAPRIFTQGGTVVAAFLSGPHLRTPFDFSSRRTPDFSRIAGIDREEISATMVSHFWDLVTLNKREITEDRVRLRGTLRKIRAKGGRGVHLVKPREIFAGARTVIRPGVVLDATDGPILLGAGVHLMPNAVILGPAVIGAGTTIKVGAKIYGGTTIGEQCKVGGEVEGSVMLAWSNKQHDGFLGHSYLASWVNLGADTNTSDLKNTYGPVHVVRGGEKTNTGLQFLGLTMGDHSKSGINMMFDTGTVVGACCNLFGPGMPPKEVPSFTWGSAGNLTTFDPHKGYDVMKIVMARRNVRPGGAYEKTVMAVFDSTAADRRRAGVR